MKKLMIVGNWKCNKTVGEAEEWIKQFSISNDQFSNNLEIILCAPFTLLPFLATKLKSDKATKLKLGAQDVSPFPDGAYTGEVSARMLKDLGVEYVMIGHSERRKYFQEDEQMLANKVKEALDVGLIPIYCVQGKTTPVPDGVKILLYEPQAAIGTGQAGSPEEADQVAKSLREILGRDVMILYGGSVNPENVASFCRQENLNGIGIGGVSLDANKFLEVIKNAAQI